jgi:3'(2'), 5'-bisphosphate nucleotidase
MSDVTNAGGCGNHVDVSRDTLEALVLLAEEAGRAILAVVDIGKQDKSDGSPITNADRAANEVICRGLAQLDPSIPIVSEEADEPPLGSPEGTAGSAEGTADERSTWRRYWLVDPLDGTKEFIAGYPDYTVNIALIEDGEPVLGVIGAPAMQTLYFAGRGLGSWKRCAEGDDVRLYARTPAADAKLRIVESRSHPSAELERFLEPLPIGERIKTGSSLKFCLIAEGRADLYPRLGPTMAWDVAAGDCVFRHACDGEPHVSPIRYDPCQLRQPGFVIGFLPAGR